MGVWSPKLVGLRTSLGIFFFRQHRELLDDFLEPAAAFSVGMNSERLWFIDLCIGLVQFLKRSYFVTQGLNSA